MRISCSRVKTANLSLQELKVECSDRFNISAWDGGEGGGEYLSCFAPSPLPELPNSVMYSILGVLGLLR